MTQLLNVNKLKKSFGNLVAVNRLSFYVEEGEMLGIVGANAGSILWRFLRRYIDDNLISRCPRLRTAFKLPLGAACSCTTRYLLGMQLQ